MNCKSKLIRPQRSGRRSVAEALKIEVSNSSGGLEMAKAQERTQRRHVRDEATIDHLGQDAY
jgi:hypothetical protein